MTFARADKIIADMITASAPIYLALFMILSFLDGAVFWRCSRSTTFAIRWRLFATMPTYVQRNIALVTFEQKVIKAVPWVTDMPATWPGRWSGHGPGIGATWVRRWCGHGPSACRKIGTGT